MAIPLCHFVVALAFLVVGVVGGTVMAVTSLSGLADVAHVHVTLLGWIAVTIMGAMTQFVPVWSGVSIHSRRLAVAQLWLVVAGLVGFSIALLAGALSWLPIVAAPILIGLWLFVYNVGRTLLAARPLDVTERHFAFALACFAALAPLGYLLAVDFSRPILEGGLLARGDVILLHATLALYGAILATIVGALLQLTQMFAQVDLVSLEHHLLELEELLFPAGVLVLATGRGLAVEPIARFGAVATLVGLVASLAAWVGLTATVWAFDPAGYAGLFGHPEATSLLVVGVFSFVVVGSLYHIVPFIVWLERYSDRLGLEQVPMIDDCYDHRLERADFTLTVVGFLGLTAGPLFGLPAGVTVVGGVVAGIGFCLFVVNMLVTIHRHGPNGIVGVLVGANALDVDDSQRLGRTSGDTSEPDDTGPDGSRP